MIYSHKKCFNKVTVVLFISFIMSACGGDHKSKPLESEPVASVILTPENIQVQVGVNANLSVETLSATNIVLLERAVTWSSSDNDIATVSNSGVIQPLLPGLIQVTATSEGVSDFIYVDVYLNRTSAVLLIREQIVNELADLRAVVSLMTIEPLPIGTVITVPEELTTRTVFEFDSPAYFALIDPMPTAKFGHKVEFVMVDALTGAITREVEFDLPIVNGELYWSTFEERFTSNERFEPKTNEQILGPVVLDILEWEEDENSPDFSFSPLLSKLPKTRSNSYISQLAGKKDGVAGKMVGVVVASGSDAEIVADAKSMGDMMEGYGFTVERFDSKTDTLADVIAGIKSVAEGLGPEDKFMFYISSHTELNDDNNDNKPDGNRALRLDYGKDQDTETKWTIMNKGSSANDLIKLIGEIKAGTINLVIDACYAESVIINMTKPVVKSITPFKPKTDQNVHVFASSARDLTSEGASPLETIGSWLGGEIGSTYTETIVKDLNGARANADTDGDGTISTAEFEAVFRGAHLKAEGSLMQKPKNKTFAGDPAPDVSLHIDDPSEDTFVCNTEEPVNDPAVDIVGVNISRTGDITKIEVAMAEPPAESFEDYSFALLIQSMNFNALIEMHAGQQQQGLLNSSGLVIPDTESVASIGSNTVNFWAPEGINLEGTQIYIDAFHTESEGGNTTCDSTNLGGAWAF